MARKFRASSVASQAFTAPAGGPVWTATLAVEAVPVPTALMAETRKE